MGKCFWGLLIAVAASAQQPARDKAAFEKVCGACHSTSLISDLKSGSEWQDTVGYMVDHGAKGTKEQLAGIMRHLARNFTRVNVNVATAAEIAPVLEVNESLAQSIVDYRAKHGEFTALDDLKKVPGIPAAKLDARRERIAFR